jgi:murein L,D-transpeptidase YcbB/YkuD
MTRLLVLAFTVATALAGPAALRANGTDPAAAGTASAVLDPVAADIRARLGGAGPSDPIVVRGRGLLAPATLRAFYSARRYAPVWQTATNAGADLTDLLQAITSAHEHGLDPEAYHASLLQGLRTEAAAAAELELLATDAFVRHAMHRAHGRLTPGDVDPEWHLFVPEADARSLLGQLAEGVPASFLLDDLWPRSSQYWALLEEKQRLAARGTGAPPPVSGGKLLRRGDRGPRVAELRARLAVPAPFAGQADETLFDAELDAAVRRFQAEQGLAVDGIVGPDTLDLLNISDAARIERIDVNLERWRWLMRTLPPTRVQVNVADYALQVFEDGAEALRMNVIVGTPFRRTPVFTENMRYLVFNPYWNVPRRIAVQDKLPLLQKDPAPLAALGYQAREASVDAVMQSVDTIDWSTVTPAGFNYLLRQKPGDDNALGRVKFILPNPYAVYLHDTPARELFARSGRAFSSGCIRLEHAMQLADWVLKDRPDWTRERIDAVLAAGEPMEVPLTRPLPVLVLYFTVVAADPGTIHYRPDLYGRDKTVATALRTF